MPPVRRKRSVAVNSPPVAVSGSVDTPSSMVAPTPASTIPASRATPLSIDSGSSQNGKKVRGPTMGKDLQRLIDVNGGSRFKVSVDTDQGRPLDKVQSAKLSNELGLISRKFMPCPVSFKKLPETEKKRAYRLIKMRLDVDGLDECDRVKKTVEELLGTRLRNRRYAFHRHYKSFESHEKALKNAPPKVDDDEWKALCNYWSLPEVQGKCRKAALSRSQMKVPHNQGTRAFVCYRHELSKKEDNEEEVDRIKFYKHTHFTEGKGWTSQEAEEKYISVFKIYF